jgi:hypothetical protein
MWSKKFMFCSYILPDPQIVCVIKTTDVDAHFNCIIAWFAFVFYVGGKHIFYKWQHINDGQIFCCRSNRMHLLVECE